MAIPATSSPHSLPRSSKMSEAALLLSPKSVLANALLRSIDLLRPRVLANRPARIEFVVGTQINGAPHLGTNLVQTSAFLLAKLARREFSIDTTVRVGALDNAPYDVVLDPETHTASQQTYFHALGKDKISELIDTYYRAFFDSVSEATDTAYAVETYSDQQATPAFRAEFLRSLERLDEIRWWLAPRMGPSMSGSRARSAVGRRNVPTGRSWRASTRTERPSLRCASITAPTRRTSTPKTISPTSTWPPSTATWSRRAPAAGDSVLQVMMKGGDWAFGCQLVDGALGALGTPARQMPIRVFTPQVLAPTGAKLSKSLLREHGRGVLPADVEPWMLDTTAWPGTVDNYVDALAWLVSQPLTDPKHFFRSFTVKELRRLMTERPTEPLIRAHEMGIYRRYFDLIAAGRKTTEIRVNDSSRKNIKPGSLIRFRCQGDEVLTRVTRVARYTDFDAMFDSESVAAVNPLATREEQLANIRQIYPPEREALGVVAIGIELVNP